MPGPPPPSASYSLKIIDSSDEDEDDEDEDEDEDDIHGDNDTILEEQCMPFISNNCGACTGAVSPASSGTPKAESAEEDEEEEANVISPPANKTKKKKKRKKKKRTKKSKIGNCGMTSDAVNTTTNNNTNTKSSQQNQKKTVQFDSVHVRYFERCLGRCVVSSFGFVVVCSCVRICANVWSKKSSRCTMVNGHCPSLFSIDYCTTR